MELVASRATIPFGTAGGRVSDSDIRGHGARREELW